MKGLYRFMMPLVALVTLAMPLKADAQLLTVADGTATNAYVPIYGYYCDAPQHNQIIYHDSMLTSMEGQYITSMMWYLSTPASSSWGTTVTIKMAVVTGTAVSTLLTVPDTAFTTVWTGPVDGLSTTQAFTLTTPFYYDDGNLLVDITTTEGDYSSAYYFGITSSVQSSICTYSYYGGSPNNFPQSFVPKTTFTYNATGDVCYYPADINQDAATTSSITFHWTPGGSESEWDVMVGDSLFAGVTDTFLTVNDLNPASYYNISIRAVCGYDDTSLWSPVVGMSTGCASIATLPWTAGFENDAANTVPLCWLTPSVFDISQPYSSTSLVTPSVMTDPSYYSVAYSGVNSVLFQYINYFGTPQNSDGPAILVSPYIVHDPADLHVSFYLYVDDMTDGCTFEAGVMTDRYDTSTFIPAISILGSNYPDPQVLEFYTATLTGLNGIDSLCIAFRASISSTSDYMAVAIDEVTVSEMGNCIAPTLNSGSIDSVSYESVDLSWQCSGEPGSFNVMLIHGSGASLDTIHQESFDTTAHVTLLQPNTTYTAYVASLCSGDTTDYVFIGYFTTHLRCYSVVDPACVALTANAATVAWGFTGTGIAPTSVELVLTDLTDTTVAPLTVSVIGDSIHSFSGLTEAHQYHVDFLTLCGSDDSSAVVGLNFMPMAPPCAEVTGSGTSTAIPFNSNYNYGFSEALYDASIVAGVDSVYGITLQVATPITRSHTVDIYMGYTTRSLLNAGAYVPVSQMTRVVTNYPLYVGRAGWTDIIPFDTAFVTRPTGDSLNLVIAFYNHAGTYSYGLLWSVHTSPIGTSVFYYTDSYLDVATPFSGGGTTSTNAPNIQLYGSCGGGDCVAPSVAVSAIDTASATLTWLPGGSESSWTVQYRQAGTTAWTTAGTATAMPYVVTGLASGTEYQFRMGSNCTDTVVFSTVANGTTACGSMSAPFFILPDGENFCWTYTGSGYYDTYDNAYDIYTGATIITPVIADTISTLQVVLEVYGDPYYVGVCDANGLNPVWMDTVDPLYDYVFKTKKSYLNNYTGTGNRIVIKASSGYGDTYIRRISIEPLATCMPVDSLTLDSVSTTEAWFSWASDGSSFEVDYISESDTVWQTTTVTANGVHLTGLASAGRYFVKVYNVCSATDRSDSVMMRFATGCVVSTTPFIETFGLTDLPLCWSAVNVAASTGWEESATYEEDALFSEAPGLSATATDWLMTPVIQLPANTDNYQLIYYLGGAPEDYFASSVASCELRLSTTGSGDTSAYTTLLRTDTVNTIDYTTYSFTLNDIHVALNAYAGQQVSFAFVNRSRFYGVVYLADVEVRDVVSPRYDVAGDASAFTGDTASFYAIYHEGVRDSMTLQWHSTMQAAGQAVMLAGTPDSVLRMVYSAEGIDTVSLIATNQYGADTTSVRIYVYSCSPVVDFPYHESFESEVAPAGCWTLVYADGDPTVNTMEHTDEIGYSLAGGVPDGNRVFRFSSWDETSDYNQYLISREFAGSNMVLRFKYAKYASYTEQIRVGYSSTTRDTASFTWGAWLNPSYTEWTEFVDTMPDGTKFFAIQYFGDYEYYVYIDDVVVTGTPACVAPTVTGIVAGEDSFVISYNSVADSVEIIVTSGVFDPTASGVISASSPYTATGLTNSTTYTIAVRSICGAGDVSDWTVVRDSTLMVDCQTPTGLTVQATTYTTATIGWTANGEETAWDIRAYNTVDTVIQTTTVNPCTISGLISGMTYNVQVRALCGQNSDIEGYWSVPIQVTTEACAGVNGVDVDNITAHSAIVSWQPSASAMGYRVSYGEYDFYEVDATRVEVAANTTSYTISGLAAETHYEFYVQAKCGEGLYSVVTASDRVDFMTLSSEDGIYDVAAGTFTLFPNPASSSVTLTVSGFDGEVTVEIVDLNGKRISELRTLNSELQIDLGRFAQGAYFVRVTGERQTAVRKLIIR